MEPSAQERERMKRYSEYFFLPKCNMRGNIRAHKKKTKEEEKKAEREQKRTVAREEVGGPSSRSRWCCSPSPSSLSFILRERTREVNIIVVHI